MIISDFGHLGDLASDLTILGTCFLFYKKQAPNMAKSSAEDGKMPVRSEEISKFCFFLAQVSI